MALTEKFQQDLHAIAPAEPGVKNSLVAGQRTLDDSDFVSRFDAFQAQVGLALYAAQSPAQLPDQVLGDHRGIVSVAHQAVRVFNPAQPIRAHVIQVHMDE